MCSVVSKISCALLALGMAIPFVAMAEPVVTVEGPTGGVYPGVAQEIRYSVRWSAAEDYVVEAPVWKGTLDFSVARTEVGVDAVDGAYYRFVVVVTPEALGAFVVPAVEIPYTVAGAVTGEGIAQLVVEAPEFSLTVRQDRTSQYIAGGLLAVAFILILVVVVSVRRRRSVPGEIEEAPQVRFQRLLHEARQRRLDGDLYGYYQALASLARELDKGLHQSLSAKVQSVGFGGVRPSDDELDGDLRAVERAVTRWNEEE